MSYMFKIFNNKDELFFILKTYGKNVFESDDENASLIAFICNYIEKKYNDKTYDSFNDNEMQTIINTFKKIFEPVDLNSVKTDGNIGSGAYSVILEQLDGNIIKILEKKDLNLNNDNDRYIFYENFMKETITYFVMLSILYFIDESTNNKYNFVNMQSKIIRPFITYLDDQK